MPDILRVTPKVAPIRFVGILFTTTAPFEFSARELSSVQRVQLAGHTDFTVQVSRDAGRTWHRYQPSERDRVEAAQA